MPEESLVDQYAVDDGEHSAVDSPQPSPVPAAQPAASVASEPPPVSRPRNPDGTFATVQETPQVRQNEPQHPRWLVQQAQDFGFADEDIQSLPTDQLGEIVSRVARSVHKITRENQRAEQTHNPNPPPAAPLAPPPEEELDLGFSAELGRNATEKDYDANLMKLFKFQQKALKEMRAEVAALRQGEQVRQVETMAERIDRLFSALPDSHKGLFGEGAGREMQSDAAEYARRMAVLTEAARLAGPNATADQQLKKFKQAVTNLFGAPASSSPEQRTQAALAAPKIPSNGISPERWANGALGRPTQRTGAPELPGPEKAKESVRTLLSEMRMDPEASGEAELDDFPG